MVGSKKRDILKIGDKKGTLTLVKRVEDFDGNSDTRAQWLAKCECGEIKKIVNRNFRRRDAPSCGKKECRLVAKARVQK